MGKRTRLTALLLAASLLLNMAVLPVHAADTVPSSTQTEEAPKAEAGEETTPATAAETIPTTQETVPESAAETTPTGEPETLPATEPETEPEPTEPQASRYLLAVEELTPDGSNTITIDSPAKLILLSNQDPQTYQTCNLRFVYNSTEFNTNQTLEDGNTTYSFQGLGSSAYPFAGRLIFPTGSEVTITLVQPLFRALSTQSRFQDQNGNAVSVKLKNYSAKSALLAQEVSGTAAADWSVTAYDDTDKDADQTNPAILGTVKEGSTVALSLVNGYTKPVGSAATAGLLCGSLEADASLTLKTYSGTQAISVRTSGMTGGLVGWMGGNTTLTVTKAAADNLSFDTITSTAREAGGLVGVMEAGAALDYPAEALEIAGISAGKHAGGIAGYAEDLKNGSSLPTVNITGTVSGKEYVGGLFGYYRYSGAQGAYAGGDSRAVIGAGLETAAGGSGEAKAVGGLYGYLENTSATGADFQVTGKADFSVTKLSGGNAGGLIGKYQAACLKSALTVDVGKVTVANETGVGAYGGLIGYVSGSKGAYVEVRGAEISGAGSNAGNAGGVIGALSDEGHMVKLSGVTVTATPNASGNAGGLVGTMPSGALWLAAGITLPDTACQGGNHRGWVLGDRDNTLVFTDQTGWNSEKGSINDVGTWGQVVQATGDLANLLTIDEEAHTVTVCDANGAYTVASKQDFAAVALRCAIQGKNALVVNRLSGSVEINLAADIDLNGTGITGFQRDNETNNTQLSVTVRGNGHTVTLPGIAIYATSNSNNGVRDHTRQGLFTNNSLLTVENLTVRGSIPVTVLNDARVDIGALSAYTTTAKLTGVTAGVNITADAAGNTRLTDDSRLSGMITTAANAEFTDCLWNGSITENTRAQNVIGGFYGKNTTNTTITVKNSTLSGRITKTAAVDYAVYGGLAASLVDGNGLQNTVTVDGLTVENVSITAAAQAGSQYAGGLLGFEWLNTTANISGVEIKNSSLNAGRAQFGGLVYKGSGMWTLNENDGIRFTGSNAFRGGSPADTPSGLLVGRGDRTEQARQNALYLEIRDGGYEIDDGSVTVDVDTSYFDEIVGINRSALGNGIVSIATKNHALIDQNGCNTYQNRVDSNWKNGHTRYYYNLDQFRADNPAFAGAVTDAPTMMLWDAYHDCYSGLRQYFTKNVRSSGTVTGEIDLSGYSYYPVPSMGEEIREATITFAYRELNTVEINCPNKRLDDADSQHYDMHTGIFSSVQAEGSSGKTLNVTDLTLKGNVGRSSTGWGALVCGEVAGTSTTAKVTLNVNGLNLAGIRVTPALTDTDTRAPLLIHTIGDYTTLDMKGVKTTGGYDDLTAGQYAASSLIGPVGSETGRQIQLTFSGMSLDGRSGRPANKIHNTNGSIFSRALFLESFTYAESSRGTYNFTESEKDACTLGRELSNTEGGAVSGRNNGKQYLYYNSETEVCPSGEDKMTYFRDYVRYVNQAENGKTLHELDINLKVPGLTQGCGTYSHPYIITSAEQLLGLNEALGGTGKDSWPVNLDLEVLANVKSGTSFAGSDPHTDESQGKCFQYQSENGKWNRTDGTVTENIDKTVVQRYLRNAYYKLANDIAFTAADNWTGLGTNTAEEAFSGVIDGGGHTVTVTPNGTAVTQSAGLVKFSMGSVIRDVTVRYTAAPAVGYNKVPQDNEASFFGGIVGWSLGGDTVLEKVTVTYAGGQPSSASYLAAVGGYVGMVGGYLEGTSANSQVLNYGGGVIFRGTIGGGLTADADRNFYYNPYVGRVLDGYALSEDGTLDNTDKNYQIPTVSAGTHLTISDGSVSVLDAQGLWLLSALANSGAASVNQGKAYTYGRVRTGTYGNIGSADVDAGASFDDGYLGCVEGKNKSATYLSRYVQGTGDTTLTGSAVTVAFGADCNMEGFGNGFRGIGTSYGTNVYANSNDRLLLVSAVEGNGHTVTLNQNRREYQAERLNWTTIGTGLFVLMRISKDRNLTVSDLTLTGSTGITYYKDAANPCAQDEVLYSTSLWDNGSRVNMVSAGMLISGFAKGCTGAEVEIKNVALKNAAVNEGSVGSMVAGGMIGALGTGMNQYYGNDTGNQSLDGLTSVTLTDCTYDTLKVTALAEAGGLVGYMKMSRGRISYTGDALLKNAAVRATLTQSLAYTANNSHGGEFIREDAGGLVGMTDRYNSLCRLDIQAAEGSYVTLQDLDISVSQNASGRESNAGGLVGFQMIGSNAAQDAPCTISGVRLEGTVCIYNVTERAANDSAVRSNLGGLVGFVSDDDAGNWSAGGRKFYLEIRDVQIGSQTGSQVTLHGGRQLAGLVALYKNPGGAITISDVQVGGENGRVLITGGSTATGDCIAGGLLGVVCLSSNVYVDETELRNTTVLSRRAAGGTVGQIENQAGTAAAVELKNLTVRDCAIAVRQKHSTGGVGGIYGLLTRNNANMTGYNILFQDNTIGYLLNANGNNLAGTLPDDALTSSEKYGLGKNGSNYSTFEAIAGDTSYVDDNAGIFGGRRTVANHKIKFTGVSLQQKANTVPMKDFAADLSTDEYLVRADYTGARTETAATQAPYVTTSPGSPLTALLSPSVSITGDGAGFDGTGTVIGKKILLDAQSKDDKNLHHTGVSDPDQNGETVLDILSTLGYGSFDSFRDAGDNDGYTGADFPVLVISTTSTWEANQVLYSALSLLTNRVMYDAASDSRGLKPAKPDDMTLSATDYAWDGTHFVAGESGSGSFTLLEDSTIKLNGRYDNQNSRFTLLDAAFTDPKGGTEVVYHLYIPVLVRKVFEFKFWAAAQVGTTYVTGAYDTLSGAALASNGEQVTALLGFDYTRTAAEWQKSVDSGEDLLWNFSKKLLLTQGLPGDTRLTLVDRSGKDKSYSALFRNAATAAGSGSYSLDFAKFTDGAGTAWEPVLLCDMLELTAEKSTAGTYVRLADSTGATLRVSDGHYYRLATDEDPAGDRYTLTVGITQPISEQYYLTVQTPGSETGVSNFEITSANRLENPAGHGLPTKRIKVAGDRDFARNGSEHHVVIGSFFRQSVSLNTRLRTPNDEKIASGDSVIQADLETTISFRDENSAGLFATYAAGQSLHQCFELSFFAYDDNEQSKTQVNIAAGTVITAVFHYGNQTWTQTYPVDEPTRVYRLMFPGDIPADDLSGDGTSISMELTLDFADSAIAEQFPVRDKESSRAGIRIEASSILAFLPESLSSSSISQHTTDGQSKNFYRGDIQSSTLNYYPSDAAALESVNQLGINGFEGTASRLLSRATYNVSAVSGAVDARFLQVTMTLSPRSNTAAQPNTVLYGSTVPWNDYLSGGIAQAMQLQANYMKPGSSEVQTAANPTNTQNNLDNTFTAKFALDSGLDKDYPIQIPVDMLLLTGSRLEAKGLTYANYKIRMVVELLDENGILINGSRAEDYIVYTNAKIYKNIIRTAN